MALGAEYVQINRVDNGWTLTSYLAGSHVTLVAKTVEELCGFIKGMEWTTPRPLYASDKRIETDVQRSAVQYTREGSELPSRPFTP